jgi:hypothetical protein
MSRRLWCVGLACLVSGLCSFSAGLLAPRRAAAQSGCSQACTFGDTGACSGSTTVGCPGCQTVVSCWDSSGNTRYTGNATNLTTTGNQEVTTIQMPCQETSPCGTNGTVQGSCTLNVFGSTYCNTSGFGGCTQCHIDDMGWTTSSWYNQCQLQLGQGCGPS